MLTDSRLDKIWRPFKNNAENKWSRWLEELQEGNLKNILLALGKKIPTKCIITQKLKLKFTFCKLNPMFHHLLELAIWARHQIEWENMREQLFQAGLTHEDFIKLQQNNHHGN